ncbi:hypothetical protein JCM17844_08540 [Iodidimonas gelatinilytica]|uniref:DUF58 domain-containing protein n=2 Tax=Iodidimonas gelatinilytica TaxID=1236966 RepID=A0A5A7MMP5_9PROT|nr:DUF58 domain-containing protein [Iodidimonas gelatinilytica]GEQ97217.1 hypothetical protein JCM17844_08540 [Iodidimonas gelatinilytica]
MKRPISNALGQKASPALVPMMDLWQRAQSLADRLPAHQIRADKRLHAAQKGVHGRRRAGPGDSFWQFRPYENGEQASNIDWRRSGRSDALYVRQQEWETAQNIWFWVDSSASMQFRSPLAQDSKADRAILLALATARLLTGAGERVGLYGQHEKAAGGRFGLERLLEAISRTRMTDCPPFPQSKPLDRHAHLILIGDFLGGEDDTRQKLRQLVGLGVAGHLMQIVDPVESDFPYRGRVRFLGMEHEDSLLLDRADDLADSYRKRMKAWSSMLGDMTRRAGWTHSVHRSDHSPALALLTLIALTGRTG